MNVQVLLSRFERRLDRSERPLVKILERLQAMSKELDDLKSAVGRNTSVIGSAITLLQGLKQKLDDAIASGDPAALTSLSAELGAQDQALADAVTANTPAESSGDGAAPSSSPAGS